MGKEYVAEVGEIYRCGTWFAGQVDDVNVISAGAAAEGANATGFDCLLLKPVADAMPKLQDLIDQAFDILRERVEHLGDALHGAARQYADTDGELADLLDATVEENPSGTHNGPGI